MSFECKSSEIFEKELFKSKLSTSELINSELNESKELSTYIHVESSETESLLKGPVVLRLQESVCQKDKEKNRRTRTDSLNGRALYNWVQPCRGILKIYAEYFAFFPLIVCLNSHNPLRARSRDCVAHGPRKHPRACSQSSNQR